MKIVSGHRWRGVIALTAVAWICAARSLGHAQAGTEIGGEWQGIYFGFPELVRLNVTLRGPADALEGEVQVAPLDEREFNVMGGMRGSFQVRGRYNATSRMFSLEPGAWIKAPQSMAKPVALGLTGVLSPDARGAAGIFPKAPIGMNPHFALARPSQAKQLLLDRALKLMDTVSNRPSVGTILRGQGIPIGGGGEDLRRVVAWASKLTQEYPQMDLPNTQFQNVYLAARPLFDDSHFAPHFGKTFDQMSAGDRRKVFDAFRPKGRESEEERSLRAKYEALGRAFSASGEYSARDVGVATLSIRIIRQWRDDMLKRMTTLPREQSSLSRLDAVNDAFKQLEVAFFPSDRQLAAAAVADARARIATGPQ